MRLARTRNRRRRHAEREHSFFFSAAHSAKDSGIALELARKLDSRYRSRATKEQYDHIIAEDLGDSTNPASPNSRSKTATNIPAIARESMSHSRSKKLALCLKPLQLEFIRRTSCTKCVGLPSLFCLTQQGSLTNSPAVRDEKSDLPRL
jgi:hypothetical protein